MKIIINNSSMVPIYEQIMEQIKAQIDGEEERKKAFQQMVRSLLDES